MDFINWEEMTREKIYDKNLYDKIINISDVVERAKQEQELFNKAKSFKIKTTVISAFKEYKKNKLKQKQELQKEQEEKKQFEKELNNIIDFGNNAPIKQLVAPNYFKDTKNCIRIMNKGTLVTNTLLQPIAILRNYETDEELIKIAFLNREKWSYFIIPREILMHTGKIIKIANKGVDVTSDSARFLVAFIRDLIVNNDIPQYNSTGKMGWHNNSFLPYDENVEFDGEEDFKSAFKSIGSKGSYEKWLNQVLKDRNNNVPLKLVMATSFASPLLYLLNKKSFVTLVWGKTGGKKTVSGRVAMSIWGDSREGKLFYSLDSTLNFFYRIASFFNNIPVFLDELQAYKDKMGVDKLIMSLTEGVDRGKARADGGIQKNLVWNNTFIMTGEQSISTNNSGGGTLNRLIEIYITKDIVEDGIGTCNVINENYGHAGKIFIDYIKNIDKNVLQDMFTLKLNQLKSFNKTEEKQAINMAMLLLADELACKCIFTSENPLKAEEVLEYMFSKNDIDNTQRAYDMFIDDCQINKSKFNPDNPGEFWGIINDFEITIISKKLKDLVEKNGFNYNKVVKEWAEKGIIERNSSGRYSTNLSRCGIKANYIVVKVIKE